jgi:hypothetical protein
MKNKFRKKITVNKSYCYSTRLAIICEFSGIVVFIVFSFEMKINTFSRKSQTAQGAGTLW